jgi:ATP-dependent Clp protease ATP-binding subunit ClpC
MTDKHPEESARTSESLLSFFSPEHLKEPSLTADVLRVLVMANDEARKLSHKRTGPEHILLALTQHGGQAAEALESVGLNYEKARQVVVEQAESVKIEPKQRPILSKLLDAILVMFRQRPFSNDAWLLMHGSIEEATLMNSPETTAEHILLALLNKSDIDSENNMHRFGINTKELRENLLQLMRTDPNPHI